MQVAFGYEVRVPQESGWLQRIRAHEMATVQLRRATIDPVPAFLATVPKVGEWGILGDLAQLERHAYFRSELGLLHGLAASRPAPASAPFTDYRHADAVEAPCATVEQFEAAAQRRDWDKSFPWAWRPFDPSRATRRQTDVNERKSPKGGLRDEARERAIEAGLRLCLKEAGRYAVVGDRVMRVAGEPVWEVMETGPARVVATCDHAGGLSRRPVEGSYFAADRLAEAVARSAAVHRCRPERVEVVGDIAVAAGTEVRFRPEAAEALNGLHAFLESSAMLIAAAPADAAREWLAIRGTVLDHPDPKFMDVFSDAGFAAQVAELARAAFRFVGIVGRTGLVDDSRIAVVGGALRSMRERLGALRGDAFPGNDADRFSEMDEHALEALS